MSCVQSKKFASVLLVFQLAFVVLFALITDYDPESSAKNPDHSRDVARNGTDPEGNSVTKYYPMFQDVHVMIFIGFGFLMTFLRRYGFSAVGLNFLIAAFVIQWAMIFHALLELGHGTYHISIVSLLTADFAAAAVLISFGALLGKTSPLQLIIMAFIEIAVFSINEWVGLTKFMAVDVGGSMFVHVFGAYFGLAVARVLHNKEVERSTKEGSVYHSDIFAMIGTVFLWMYWPSFNSGIAAPGDDQHRAVINTYLALAACCVTSFVVSSFTERRGKFDMVHIQNATLAGGVAVGTTADMMIMPWGAVVIGMLAGLLSTMGYRFVSPFLTSKLKIHDTCGVNNLHGMPGLFAGICGIFGAWFATEAQYGLSLYATFPARAPAHNSTELQTIQGMFTVDPGVGRSAGQQALYQFVALIVTFLVAIMSGAVTGFILRIRCLDGPTAGGKMFDDALWWETPDDFNEEESDELLAENGREMMSKDKLVNEDV